MSAYWFLFHKSDIILTEKGQVLYSGSMPFPTIAAGNIYSLPKIDNVPCYAAYINAPFIEKGYQAVALRASFDILPPVFYTMAGKASELLHWDANTAYCGKCGALMKRHTDISKVCSRCGREIWPSPVAAIIVAITRNDEILLVQSKNFKGDYFGLVAGFVETGETLEDCVHREVLEETGITLKNLKYFASQAWPYPFNIMVGFTAEYAYGDLKLQQSELNKGDWYKLDKLPEIPGKVSLAHQLIDAVKKDICHL